MWRSHFCLYCENGVNMCRGTLLMSHHVSNVNKSGTQTQRCLKILMWRSNFCFSCENCGLHFTTRKYITRLMWSSHQLVFFPFEKWKRLLIQTCFHTWMKTLDILVKNLTNSKSLFNPIMNKYGILVKNVINYLIKKKLTKTYSIWHDLGTGHIQSVMIFFTFL